MRTYTVTVTREDHLWVAVASGLPKGVVGAMDYEHFLELREDFPIYLGELLEISSADISIRWIYQINGKDVTSQLRKLLLAEEELLRTRQSQEDARKEALSALTDAGLSQRAMADVVGVSPQRINQLVHS